jgi:hypothetical protein
MLRSINCLRLLAVCLVLIAFTGAASAFPAIKPAGSKNKNSKPTTSGPIPTAIKDLQAAIKILEDKKLSPASDAVHAAESIIKDQTRLAKQPEKQGGDKDRATALDGVLKDIKEAEGQIAAHKPDEATKAIRSAIGGLQGLSDAVDTKKK